MLLFRLLPLFYHYSSLSFSLFSLPLPLSHFFYSPIIRPFLSFYPSPILSTSLRKNSIPSSISIPILT